MVTVTLKSDYLDLYDLLFFCVLRIAEIKLVHPFFVLFHALWFRYLDEVPLVMFSQGKIYETWYLMKVFERKRELREDF